MDSELDHKGSESLFSPEDLGVQGAEAARSDQPVGFVCLFMEEITLSSIKESKNTAHTSHQ